MRKGVEARIVGAACSTIALGDIHRLWFEIMTFYLITGPPQHARTDISISDVSKDILDLEC